jgi:hypothetical protein
LLGSAPASQGSAPATTAQALADSTAGNAKAGSAPAALQPVSADPSTEASAPATNDAPTQAAAASAAPTTAASLRLRIASYLSIETRVRMLARHVDLAAQAPGNESVQPLQQQFGAVVDRLQPGQGAAQPSLGDFLRALAEDLGQPQRASVAFSLSLRGSFVSTAA